MMTLEQMGTELTRAWVSVAAAMKENGMPDPAIESFGQMFALGAATAIGVAASLVDSIDEPQVNLTDVRDPLRALKHAIEMELMTTGPAAPPGELDSDVQQMVGGDSGDGGNLAPQQGEVPAL